MSAIQQTPLARILSHEADYWTSIAQVEQRDGWKLYHNADFPRRFDPNHAGDFRADDGQGNAIAAEIIDFYQARGTAPVAYVDLLATPADLLPELLAAGFQEWSGAWSDLMMYVGPDEAKASYVPVITVRSEQERADWASIIDEADDEQTRTILPKLYSREIADPRMTAYLAYVDREPAARCELFSADRLGRVEAVRTMATFRGRGLAAILIRKAIRDSVSQGNHLTYIYAEPGGDAQRLYTRLGFRVVARNLIRSFFR